MSTICPACGVQNLEGLDECANCGNDLRTLDLPRPTTSVEQAVMQLPLTALTLTRPHVLSPDTTLEETIHTFTRQLIDIVEVVKDGKLVGLLSVRDLVTRVGPNYQDKLKMPIGRFMTLHPETLPPDAPINFAINMMDLGGFRHVPVVQDGRMVGVVSARDVVGHVLQHAHDGTAWALQTT